MFSQQLVFHACLAVGGAFLQRGTYIMILHIREWSKQKSITFITFQDQVPKKLHNVIGFDTGTSLACAWRVPKSNPIYNTYNLLNIFASGRFPKKLSENFKNFQKISENFRKFQNYNT